MALARYRFEVVRGLAVAFVSHVERGLLRPVCVATYLEAVEALREAAEGRRELPTAFTLELPLGPEDLRLALAVIEAALLMGRRELAEEAARAAARGDVGLVRAVAASIAV